MLKSNANDFTEHEHQPQTWIISESAGAGKRQYSFVMDRFKKLVSGEIV